MSVGYNFLRWGEEGLKYGCNHMMLLGTAQIPYLLVRISVTL